MKAKKLIWLGVIALASCQGGTSETISTPISESTGSTSTSESVAPLRAISEDEVTSLKNNVHFTGLENFKGQTTIERSIEVIFESGKFFFKENSTAEGVLINSLVKDGDGIIYKSLDKNNEETETKLDPARYPWEHDNPFNVVTTANFVAVGENEFSLAKTQASDAVLMLTDYRQEINEFVVKTDGSKVTSISFETYNLAAVSEVFEYTYVVSEHGTATVPSLSYKDDGHAEALGAALTNLGDNFTITSVNHEEGETDVTSTVYYDDGMMYNTHPDVAQGIINGGFSQYFTFTVESEVAKIGNLIIDDFYYMLDTSFAPEFFKYDAGTSSYVAQDSYAAMIIADSLGYDEGTTKEFFYFAIDASIKLNGTSIESITVTSNVQGDIFTTTMTFSNIGTTQFPFSVSEMINGQFSGWSDAQYNIIVEYMGQDSFGDIYVPYIAMRNTDISVSGTPEILVIEGTASVGVLDAYAGELEYYGYEPETKVVGTNEITQEFNSEDFKIKLSEFTYETNTTFTITVSKKAVSGDLVPAKFVGTYTGTITSDHSFGGSKELTIVITSSSITINGVEMIIDDYSDYDGFTISDGADTYYLGQYGSGDTVDAIFLTDGEYPSGLFVMLDKTSSGGGTEEPPAGVTIPALYIGTYIGNASKEGQINGSNQITVVITATTITVNSLEATIVSYDDVAGFELTISGVDYIMYFQNQDDNSVLSLLSADWTSFSAPSLARQA